MRRQEMEGGRHMMEEVAIRYRATLRRGWCDLLEKEWRKRGKGRAA